MNIPFDYPPTKSEQAAMRTPADKRRKQTTRFQWELDAERIEKKNETKINILLWYWGPSSGERCYVEVKLR